MLSVSSARVNLPVAVSSRRQASQAVRRPVVLRRAEPATASSPVESAISEAKARCEEGTASECAQAWDDVEELSATAAHARDKAIKEDPLEKFCEGAPDADECRVYED